MKLRSWLLVHAPRDVLIPIPLGKKRPSIKYAAGVWSWGCFDEHLLAHPPSECDWSIGLRDLCVIDIVRSLLPPLFFLPPFFRPHALAPLHQDDHALAPSMEAHFPELLAAPCEKTRRGFHYFFRRSPL